MSATVSTIDLTPHEREPRERAHAIMDEIKEAAEKILEREGIFDRWYGDNVRSNVLGLTKDGKPLKAAVTRKTNATISVIFNIWERVNKDGTKDH